MKIDCNFASALKFVLIFTAAVDMASGSASATVNSTAAPSGAPSVSASFTPYVMHTLAGGGSDETTSDIAGTQSSLYAPKGVWLDNNSGTVYIAVFGTNCVRKVDSSGIISTVGGVVSTSGGTSSDNGPATSALLNGPTNVVVDSVGFVYVTDAYSKRIKKLSVGGQMSTFAGNGLSGTADGLTATSAALGELAGLWVDSVGRIYFSNYVQYTGCFLKSIGSDGIVTAYAGMTSGQTADGFPATSTTIREIPFLTGDTTGRLYFGDGYSHVRSINGGSDGSSRVLSTVIGSGVKGYSGEGTAATSTSLDLPYGVGLDSGNNVYVSLFDGMRVQTLSRGTGLVTTVAGTGTTPEGVEGGAATSGAVASPCQLAVSSGNDSSVYVTDIFWGKVRKIHYPYPSALPTVAPSLVPTVEPTTAAPTLYPTMVPFTVPSLNPSTGVSNNSSGSSTCYWSAEEDSCAGELAEVVVSSSTTSNDTASGTTVTTSIKRTYRKKN